MGCELGCFDGFPVGWFDGRDRGCRLGCCEGVL